MCAIVEFYEDTLLLLQNSNFNLQILEILVKRSQGEAFFSRGLVNLEGIIFNFLRETCVMKLTNLNLV